MTARGQEDGFSLIEIAVVLLVLAVLIGIAIPTFLGARARAADSATKGEVRNVYLLQRVHFGDDNEFTEDIEVLEQLDSSYGYTTVVGTMTPNGKFVYVDVMGDDDDTVVLGGMSSSGRCFWMRVEARAAPEFAENSCGGIPSVWTQTWS